MGVSSTHAYARHREPSQGWTTAVPAGWRSVAGGPVFVRANPWADPARLIVESQPGLAAADALRGFAAARAMRVTAPGPGHDGEHLRWAR